MVSDSEEDSVEEEPAIDPSKLQLDDEVNIKIALKWIKIKFSYIILFTLILILTVLLLYLWID